MQPLRTGAARIALGAAFDDGVPGIETVAVGLVYDDKARFRSRALVRIGEPEGIGSRRGEYERDPVGAVRSLTDDIGRQLAQVAPMYESRQQELAFRRVAAWSPTLRPGRTTSPALSGLRQRTGGDRVRGALDDAARPTRPTSRWWA